MLCYEIRHGEVNRGRGGGGGGGISITCSHVKEKERKKKKTNGILDNIDLSKYPVLHDSSSLRYYAVARSTDCAATGPGSGAVCCCFRDALPGPPLFTPACLPACSNNGDDDDGRISST